MPIAVLFALQAAVSLAALYYFVRRYRMSLDRSFLISVLAFAFTPVAVLFGEPGTLDGLMLMPIGFSVLAGIALAIVPPKRMRVSEQHVSLVAVTALYPLLLDPRTAFTAGGLLLLTVLGFCAYHLVSTERLSQTSRFLLYLVYCGLMTYLVFYQGNFFVAYMSMAGSLNLSDLPIWAGQNLLLQITVIATCARIFHLVLVLPRRSETSYFERMTEETIPFLSQRMDGRSADPRQTLAILGVHFAILVGNAFFRLLEPGQMVAVSLVVLPTAYDAGLRAHTRLNEVEDKPSRTAA